MTGEIECVVSDKTLHLAYIKGDILKQVNKSMKGNLWTGQVPVE